MQSISKLKRKYETAVHQIGNKIIINGMVYDGLTLSFNSFNPIEGRPEEVGINDNVITVPKGGQTQANITLPYSTLTIMPNYFKYDDLAEQFEVDKGYYFYGSDNSSQNHCLFTDDVNMIQRNNDGKLWSKVGVVKVNENTYITAGLNNNYSYAFIGMKVVYSPDSKTINISRAKYSYTDYYPQVLFRKGNYIYYNSGYRHNIVRISVYDITNEAVSHLGENRDNPSGRAGGTQVSNLLPGDEQETVDIKRFYSVKQASNNSFLVHLISVDTVNNTVNFEVCNLDDTGADIYNNVSHDYYFYHAFVHEFNGNWYLSIYSAFPTDRANPDKSSFRLYTYQIDKNDPKNLKFVCQHNFGQQVISGVATLDSSMNKVVFPIESGLRILTFNGNEWLANDVSTGTPRVVLYDTYGRIWITSKTGEIFMLVPEIPTVVSINFEKQEYQFLGSPIQTYVVVNAYNYLGQKVAVSGTLRILSNNAEFNDGSKVMNITTSDTTDTVVDVKITGAGAIEIVFEIDI